MTGPPNNETRARLLDVAEQLFSERGFAAVKLRDIAMAIGMRHASLYYYAPGGKEQLFIEVMERNFQRHHAGMAEAIKGAGDDIRDQVHAVTGWLVSQPPLDFARMVHADMPAIDVHEADRLMRLAYDAMRGPLVAALEQALAAGKIDVPDLDLAAVALVSLIQSVHTIPRQYRTVPLEQVGLQLANMLLNGWLTP